MRTALAVMIAVFALPTVVAGQDILGFAGGGFSGKRVPRQFELPVIEAGVISDQYVDLEITNDWDWRPTVTAGVEVRWPKASGVYLGLAGYAATLSDGDDSQRIAPGIAVTFGKGDYGFYVGTVFSGTDEIRFPNGEKTIRIRKSDVRSFKTDNTSGTPRIYFGFRGVTVGGSGD